MYAAPRRPIRERVSFVHVGLGLHQEQYSCGHAERPRTLAAILVDEQHLFPTPGQDRYCIRCMAHYHDRLAQS